MAALLCTARDLWIVAQTVWAESRGEPQDGRYAVAHVIRNRAVLHPRWRGQAPATICQAPWQFSAWNAQDPNLPQMQRLGLNDAAFVACLHIAVDVLSGQHADLTGGATHYYADTLSTPPAWARGKTPSAVLGHHRFFANIA